LHRNRWTFPAVVLAVAVGAAAAGVLRAGPPEPPPVPADLPGAAAGSIECRWIAPYVTTISASMPGTSGARTVWYAEDGKTIRNVDSAGADFVTVPAKDGGTTVYATRADWSITLPPPPPESSKLSLYVTASGDGRTFVRQQTAADATTSADVWVDGEFRGRAGPAVQWRGRSVHVGDDGSLALEAGKLPGQRGMRILFFAPGAKATFEAPCGTEESVESVAPAGRGALLRRPRDKDGDELLFASAAGLRPLDLGVNARVLAWVAGTSRAVVSSGLDTAPRLRLVDLETGTAVWDVEDQPLGGKRGWPGVAVEGDLVLVSGLEAHPVGGVSHWRRRVDALDLATGARVATWRSMDRGAIGYSEPAVFHRRRGTLFLVASDQFAPVPVKDIRAKTNRWE
jgi:hypothetical protein